MNISIPRPARPFNTSFLVQFAQTAHMIGKKDVAFDYIKTALVPGFNVV